jgi:Cu/Ag efflux protein CusF
MRSKFASIIMLTATLGFASAALATATDTVGTIKAIDAKALSVTLQDGIVYMLPKGVKLDGFKVGEKVSLMWEMKGAVHEATQIKAAS